MDARFLAEGVGFEPTDACASPVFKTGAIDHSATLPEMGEALNSIGCAPGAGPKKTRCGRSGLPSGQAPKITSA